MPKPTRVLPVPPTGWNVHIEDTLDAFVTYFNFDSGASQRMTDLAGELVARQWYPLAVRARCTLTVEGSYSPLIQP